MVNELIEKCDAWVAVEGLKADESTVCDPRNTFFVMCEAPGYKSYDPKWLKKFQHVLGYGKISHPGFEAGNTCLPWFLAGGYETFSNMATAKKTKDFSVIASSKTTIKGHRRRVWFINELAKYMKFDLYGRGWAEKFEDFPRLSALHVPWEAVETKSDKTPGLIDYKYSLAIENSSYADYWTEKISDCYLCSTMPIYWGCPNVTDYFAKESMIIIDMKDPRAAARKIETAIDEGLWERYHEAIEQARQQVLNDYNLPLLIARWVQMKKAVDAKPGKVTLEPEPTLGYMERKMEKWRRALGW